MLDCSDVGMTIHCSNSLYSHASDTAPIFSVQNEHSVGGVGLLKNNDKML